jgi:hypothetical protein
MVHVEGQTLIVTTKRVGYHGSGYCLIVPDHAVSKRHRFTVYHIPTSPSRRVRVVGRELPLGHAKKIARARLEK